MAHWLEGDTNKEHVQRLRSLLSEHDTPVFIFLGAGLSFGSGQRRTLFEYEAFDSGARFPSWLQLAGRMKMQLLAEPLFQPHADAIKEFFQREGPLDCAELFRHYTGDTIYWDFLKRQYGTEPGDDKRLTPSHTALTRLPVKEIYTTNYDELIEAAYRVKRTALRVSASPQEFMNNRAINNSHHLIKLHGTITDPQSIVLTRSDYAKSRRERSNMFEYLTSRFEYSSFLFVGFSLTDPNFNILYDDARFTRGGHNPVSYVVQGQESPVRQAYLKSLGVNSITLNHWEQMPSFLMAINPDVKLDSIDTTNY